MLEKFKFHADNKPEGLTGYYDFRLDNALLIIDHPDIEGVTQVDTVAGRRFLIIGIPDEIHEKIKG